jgi:formate dehydrogenase maturation protein FdhE
MEKLTSEQKKKYIEDNGQHCPRCGSAAIVCIDEIDTGTGAAAYTQPMGCNECEQKWHDNYTITSVEDY